jgi:hypothetical protein
MLDAELALWQQAGALRAKALLSRQKDFRAFVEAARLSLVL